MVMRLHAGPVPRLARGRGYCLMENHVHEQQSELIGVVGSGDRHAHETVFSRACALFEVPASPSTRAPWS